MWGCGHRKRLTGPIVGSVTRIASLSRDHNLGIGGEHPAWPTRLLLGAALLTFALGSLRGVTAVLPTYMAKAGKETASRASLSPELGLSCTCWVLRRDLAASSPGVPHRTRSGTILGAGESWILLLFCNAMQRVATSCNEGFNDAVKHRRDHILCAR
jgi:hypothetical protein